MRKAGSSYSIFHFECQHEIKFFVRILFSLSRSPSFSLSCERERARIPLASFICCHCYFNNPKKQNINWILSIWNAKPKKKQKKNWNEVNVLFRILPLEMHFEKLLHSHCKAWRGAFVYIFALFIQQSIENQSCVILTVACWRIEDHDL